MLRCNMQRAGSPHDQSAGQRTRAGEVAVEGTDATQQAGHGPGSVPAARGANHPAEGRTRGCAPVPERRPPLP